MCVCVCGGGGGGGGVSIDQKCISVKKSLSKSGNNVC